MMACGSGSNSGSYYEQSSYYGNLRRQSKSVVSLAPSAYSRRISELSRISRREYAGAEIFPVIDERLPSMVSRRRSSTSTTSSAQAMRGRQPSKDSLSRSSRWCFTLGEWWWRIRGFVLNESEDDGREAIDVELEEIEMSPRYRPGSIDYLCQKTRFSESEIKLLYRGFKAECPSGIAKEETFKQIYSQFFPPEANSGQYAHYLFRTLDNIGSRNGLVSFEDFVMSLSTLCRGSAEEKVRWLFLLYDQDGDGKITRSELANMVVAVYGLMANHAAPAIDDDSLLTKVDQVFQTLDQNQDGVVTTEEFLLYCCSDETFLKSMSILDDII